MNDYKVDSKAYRKQLTWRARYLDYNENPVLFLLFSWKFHFYGKVFKHYIKFLNPRRVK